jgi:5-methylthioadenosine/S-adenosylhomocysteine deaminase
MPNLLIKNGHVVSVDPNIGIQADCDVLAVDGIISEVRPGIEVDDAVVVDATGTVVIPGFIDTHRHLWQSLIRGSLPSCTLGDYFTEVMGTIGPAFGPDDVYVGNVLGAYEALNAGVTTVVDWCNCVNTPEHADGAISALKETGIRAVYGYGTPGGWEWLAGSELGHPADARRVRGQYFVSDDQLLTFALALRGPGGPLPEVNRADFEFARELDARVTVHIGMRITGHKNREIEELREFDLLGSNTTYVHCNATSDADLRLIAETGGTVSISPYIEMLMGHGHPPTGRVLDANLRPTLSVDVTTSAPGDMFTQMRTALAEDRIKAFGPDETEPFAPALTGEEVLRFATIDGAAACALEDRTGSLTPGKAADIVLVRADDINTLPSPDPVGTVVACADTSNVDTVIVGGQIVKRDGKLLNADMTRLRSIAVDARDGVLARIGKAPAGGG